MVINGNQMRAPPMARAPPAWAGEMWMRRSRLSLPPRSTVLVTALGCGRSRLSLTPKEMVLVTALDCAARAAEPAKDGWCWCWRWCWCCSPNAAARVNSERSARCCVDAAREAMMAFAAAVSSCASASLRLGLALLSWCSPGGPAPSACALHRGHVRERCSQRKTQS